MRRTHMAQRVTSNGISRGRKDAGMRRVRKERKIRRIRRWR